MKTNVYDVRGEKLHSVTIEDCACRVRILGKGGSMDDSESTSSAGMRGLV